MSVKMLSSWSRFSWFGRVMDAWGSEAGAAGMKACLCRVYGWSQGLLALSLEAPPVALSHTLDPLLIHLLACRPEASSFPRYTAPTVITVPQLSLSYVGHACESEVWSFLPALVSIHALKGFFPETRCWRWRSGWRRSVRAR